MYTENMYHAAWAIVGIGFFILIGMFYSARTDHTKPTNSVPLTTTPHATTTPHTMIIRSPAFNHEERIPSKYTCDSEDVSPPIAIDSIPEGTMSLTLIMDDPDAPHDTWDHWILFNLPATTTRIGEGAATVGVPGSNSWGRATYGGPCPSSGEHRYLIKVYALDILLPIERGARKDEVLTAMQGHVIESTTLMGRYQHI